MEQEILDDDIVIRIPRKFYNQNVQRLIDEIEYKKIVSKSQVTDEQFDELMNEIKADRKKIVKPLLDKIKDSL